MDGPRQPIGGCRSLPGGSFQASFIEGEQSEASAGELGSRFFSAAIHWIRHLTSVPSIPQADGRKLNFPQRLASSSMARSELTVHLAQTSTRSRIPSAIT